MFLGLSAAKNWRKLLVVNKSVIKIVAALFVALLPLVIVDSPIQARVLAIALLCLAVWFLEIAPPFVPTFLLWALVPLLLLPFDPTYSISTVLSWSADPVMALFFGGFCLGVATSVYGVDKRLASLIIRLGGGSFYLLLCLTIGSTAFLSMWMSNIAAAALMIACLRPLLSEFELEDRVRRILLVGVALGADLGGIATPIGTGPNAIAIASISAKTQVSFLDWMLFALPLTIGMLAVAFIFLSIRSRNIAGEWDKRSASFVDDQLETETQAKSTVPFVVLISATVLSWLTEPMHGIPAAVTSVSAAAVMFATGMLRKEHLRRIDWSTLLLIAGGITLGRLFERSGTISMLTSQMPFSDLDPTMALFAICLISALFSALMSNTATVVMLIPIATAIIPEPSTALLVAISASFGIPFVISTPQNAMAYGEGGLRTSDLFYPGIVIMVIGCLIVSLTGRYVLGLVGIQ